MLSVPADGPRHTVDSSCESPAPVTHPPERVFLQLYSSRRRLRDCEPGWACNLPDCDQCGERLALRAQADMMAKFAKYPHCVSLRLSVELSRDLDIGHTDLSSARSTFLKMARLSQTTQGYLRSTEVTRIGARWNWHDHFVVVLQGDPHTETRRLLDAWDDACRQVALRPSSHSRQSDTASAITYVLKERLGTSETSLRVLLQRAARGDADAADDFLEWDAWRRLHPRARFRSSWVRTTAPPTSQEPSRRDQHVVAAEDRELAQLSILSALGVVSKSQQAAVLGVSQATVARRRRHLPAPRPDLIPFRRSDLVLSMR
jgi:hypothetical protein